MKRIFLLSLVLCFIVLPYAFTQQTEPVPQDSVTLYIDSIYHELPEVMITGERPLVKAEQGKLVYDLPRLIANLPVDNAYDALKELPGVTETNGNISLGGQNVTVVIDGKVTTLSTEQLYALLKNIPSGRIEKAEVMYSAPARYQVRGAMINLCLMQGTTEEPSLQGELFADYQQAHYEDLTGRASLFYSRRKFSADFLYSYNHGREFFLTDKEALHSLADGNQYDINTHEIQRGRHNTHNIRLGTDYTFAQEHRLSMVYAGAFTNGHNLGIVEGNQVSNVRSRSTDQLHNARADYQIPTGTKAGAEFTFYETPSSQLLHSRMGDEQLDFRSEDRQRIHRWKAYMSQEHALAKEWNLNYGVAYATSTDNSYQYYYNPSDGELIQENNNMESRRREQTWNIYAGFNKSFSEKFSFDISVATEQYHTSVWNEWNIYPTINLSYMPSPNNVLQFSFNSNKDYPTFWAVQDAISYMGGGYSEIHGNPYLKPESNYHANLMYILKSKYMFGIWYGYTKDKSLQMLYQSPERLVEIYKCQNLAFDQQAGIQSVIPFNIKNWMNSRLILIGVYDRQKDSDYWNLPFDRKIVYGMAIMNNVFTLFSRPDIKLIISGMVRSKAIQGIYDLPASGNLDVALKYTFYKGKALLTLRCNDIFESSGISPRIRFETQNVTNNYSCFREFGVSFTYKFGGYKEKQRESVDTSRFK